MFINDLAEDLRSLGKGIQIDSSLLSCLMYADDIVVFAENPDDLQQSLDCVGSWCGKWGININPKKSQAIHFRTKRRPLSNYKLTIGSNQIAYCHEYRYLGFWINEFLNL